MARVRLSGWVTNGCCKNRSDAMLWINGANHICSLKEGQILPAVVCQLLVSSWGFWSKPFSQSDGNYLSFMNQNKPDENEKKCTNI